MRSLLAAALQRARLPGPLTAAVVKGYLESKGEAVLFSFSDRPGQEAMGLWREKRG